MEKLEKQAAILCDDKLLSSVAYFFCREEGLGTRYAIRGPESEYVQLLMEAGVLSTSGDRLIDRQFGYACYEYYRQRICPDAFDRLLLQEAAGAERVMDLCCGAGATVHALLNMGCNDNRTIYAVDHDSYGLSLLRKTLEHKSAGSSQVIIRQDDAHAVGLMAASLDLIACRTALQYLHVPTALREMHRLLARGGRLVLIVHGSGYMLDYLLARRQLLKLLNKSSAGSAKGAKFVRGASLYKRLEEAGFQSIRYIESNEWLFAGSLPVYYGITAQKP